MLLCTRQWKAPRRFIYNHKCQRKCLTFHLKDWTDCCSSIKICSLACRLCPRGPTCQASVPQTGEDTEAVVAAAATPEAEDVVTVHPDTRAALEAGSATSQLGHSIKRPTLTTEAPQWERDSGDTWTTTNRCLNVTHVSFSSPRLQRSWGQVRVDSTTLNSASRTPSIYILTWVNKTDHFKEVFPGNTELSIMWEAAETTLHPFISPSNRCDVKTGVRCLIISFCCRECMGQSSNCYAVCVSFL